MSRDMKQAIPTLRGTLGEPIGTTGERYITVTCPRCGRRNRHGWPARMAAAQRQHRQAHCACWGRSGYFVTPQDGEAAR